MSNMSDPVSQVEIEDVLSSIRRLVSEDARAPARLESEKLLLTEALRVPDAPVAEPRKGNVVEMSRRDAAPRVQPAAEPEPVASVPQAGDEMGALGRKIAALEAVIGRTDEQWEPDTPGSDDYAGTAVAPVDWDNAAQASAAADTADEPAPEPFSLGSEDAILDEDVLREMVVEIVRQELQGVLGQRITRNVRKLVRREIQRALSGQDFD